jgi:predicted MFS family arabinose efflux permease
MSDSQEKATLPIVAMVTFSVLAAEIFVVLPLLVGALVDLLGLTASQAGLVAGADMLGACISALGVSFIIPKGRWKLLLVCGIALLTLANAVSGLLHGFSALFCTRVVAGLGEGVLLAIANASIAGTRNPDRIFGFSLAGQVAFGTAALYVMPSLLTVYSLRGVFWGLAILTGAAIVLVTYMPNSARANDRSAVQVEQRSLSAGAIIGLVGVFTFFVAEGAVWAYLDRIGMSNRIEASSVATALAISSIAGFLGASLASWLDIRYGRLKPLLAAALCTIVSLLILNETTTYVVFAAMASLFNFAWNASVPYQFGALAEVDSSRRTVALGSAVVFAGLTVGPVFASRLISDSNFHSVNWMGMTFCIVSLLLFGRLLLPIEQKKVGVRGTLQHEDDR